MAGRCVACDGEIGDDAERCPSCGLAFLRETPSTAIAGPADPAHVGLYLGNGRMVHSPETGRNVEVVRLETTNYGARLVGARRVVAS